MKKMKKNFTRPISLFLALLLMVSPIFSFNIFGTTAQALTYRTGANAAAATYKAGKYYTHATSINLTGDGVTDTLSLALSQLGYYEGTTSNPYSGLYNTYDTYTSDKTTEYVYNYGDADSSGYRMAWCASFCSWAIFQAGVTNHSTHAQSCRNHIGDINYIWRECSCYQWADQLKRFDMYYARGTYTPKAGDLIFFKMSGGGTAWTNHIGLVRYSDGSKVYTVEGNRHNHVGLYSYSLSDSQICGYGVLPYPSNANAPKVDYTGKNKTAGQYITNNATLAVSSTKGGSTAFTVGKYEMFTVTGFDGSYAKVSYGGKTGYATLSSTTIQVSASEAAPVVKVTVSATDGKTSGYMGGSKLPDSNNSFENPNVLVTGLNGNTNNYKGLENYGTNKDKIIINGRTLSKWESRPGDPIINNIWVYSAGDGQAYLGIEIADTSRLRVKGREGTGEEIESIVIKRGFEIVNTTTDCWTAGEISSTSSSVGGVIGVFKENVVLTAIDNVYFNVTLGGSNSLGLDGLTFSTVTAQNVQINADANIRKGPDTTYASLGVATAGTTLEYLNETRNTKWLMVDYNGTVGWVSNVNASLVSGTSNVVLVTPENRGWQLAAGHSMNATVALSEGSQTYAYWGGSKLPAENCNYENPNFMVTGLNGTTNNYKGLENYGTNKDKIIINGRTLSKWESHTDSPIINNIWVYSDGNGKSFVGIDIANNSVLRIKGREGTGEEIESIVFKRGFEIVSTTADCWSAGEISTTSSSIGSVVGVFKENVVLTAIDNLTFNVTLGGSNSLGLDGYVFTTATAQNVKITAGAIVRSGPGATYKVLGEEEVGATFEYLDEVQNSEWLKIDYKGYVGFVSNKAASVVNGSTTVVNVTAANRDWTTEEPEIKSMDATIALSEGSQTYAYWGGSKLPAENCNYENPNFMVTGLSGNTGNYKGLENYGTNKDKIIINGRTLSKWESRPGDPIINNIWVYTGSDGKTYMGIDIADTSRLRVKGREGTGEEIESIVIKRGFEIVSTAADCWTAGEISNAPAGVGYVVGVFKENVVLTAIDNLTFNVTLGGSNDLGLDGYSFQTVAPQLVQITGGVNVRIGPDRGYTAIAFADPGETYEYLNETRDSKWFMVDYNGQVGWITSDCASIVDNTTDGAADVVLVTAANRDWEEDADLTVALSTINGAQIRTTGEQGIRFISTIEKNAAFENVEEFGTILIPSADISDISELVIGATLNGHTVAKVPAQKIYGETADTITFTAVITQIAEKNYTRAYTARAYAILNDGTIIYSDTGASRSVYEVAKKGLESSTESAANKAVFQNIVDMVEGAKDNDASWPWN
ncbi:MAG: CHAP domain-containing protein [Ruminococcaceae bacterium]|nr:CHAP domain-containing protein [Oscillospiraceae bacterium]